MKISSIKSGDNSSPQNNVNTSNSKEAKNIANPQFMDFLLDLFSFGKANPTYLNNLVNQQSPDNSNAENQTKTTDSKSSQDKLDLINNAIANQNNLLIGSQNGDFSTNTTGTQTAGLENSIINKFSDLILNNFSDFDLSKVTDFIRSPEFDKNSINQVLQKLPDNSSSLQLKNLLNIQTNLQNDIQSTMNNYLPKEILNYFENDLKNGNENIQKELYQIAVLFEKKSQMKVEKITQSGDNLQSLSNYLQENSNSVQPVSEDGMSSFQNNKDTSTKLDAKAQTFSDLSLIKNGKISELDKNSIDKIVQLQSKSPINTTNLSDNSSSAKSQFSYFPNVKYEEIPKFITKMIQLTNNGETSKATISLQPKELGMIFVNLELNNNLVNINIRAEKMQTLDKMQNSVQNLKEALATQGLKIDNINLTFDDNSTSEQNYTTNQNKNNQEQGRSNQEYAKEYEEYLTQLDSYSKLSNKIDNTTGVVK
jgi:flagellar hook-length control protein FliK